MAWMRAMPLGVGHDEARAGGPSVTAVEARPADAGAPQRCGLAAHHHLGSVAGAVEEDGLEVLVAIEAEAVEHVARQDDEARALGAERDAACPRGPRSRDRGYPRAPRTCRAIAYMAARMRKSAGGRPMPFSASMRRLALHEAEVDPAGLQQRYVLGAALGVLRPDLQRRLELVDGFGERLPVDRKAAARGCRAERRRRLFAFPCARLRQLLRKRWIAQAYRSCAAAARPRRRLRLTVNCSRLCPFPFPGACRKTRGRGSSSKSALVESVAAEAERPTGRSRHDPRNARLHSRRPPARAWPRPGCRAV